LTSILRNLVLRFEPRALPIDFRALDRVGYVVFRDTYRQAKRDARGPNVQVRLLSVAQRLNGALQHCPEEIEAKVPVMAGLLLAQEVAGAADVQVMAGEVEACSDWIGLCQRFEPAACRVGQLYARWNCQIGVRLDARASDAAAKLIELGEAEPVRIVHDHCVD